MTKSPYLDGQMLIAMPGMSDPRFERSVIYMCAHSEKAPWASSSTRRRR